jgi:hypothetical protein
VIYEAVFFGEAGSVANRTGVALDEDAALSCFDHGGCGERTRACRED